MRPRLPFCPLKSHRLTRDFTTPHGHGHVPPTHVAGRAFPAHQAPQGSRLCRRGAGFGGWLPARLLRLASLQNWKGPVSSLLVVGSTVTLAGVHEVLRLVPPFCANVKPF